MPKKVDLTVKTKQKRKSKKKEPISKYIYNIGENLIYISHVHEKQHGQECIVLGRHRKHITHYYKIQFQDESIIDTAEASLKTIEEYEIYLSEVEEKKSINNIDENELIYNSYNNYDACLNPIAFYELRCDECRYNSKCIYKNKNNYKAINIK